MKEVAVVVVVVVLATRVKRGKRAWINTVSGHWNIARPLGHSVCFLRDSLALH